MSLKSVAVSEMDFESKSQTELQMSEQHNPVQPVLDVTTVTRTFTEHSGRKKETGTHVLSVRLYTLSSPSSAIFHLQVKIFCDDHARLSEKSVFMCVHVRAGPRPTVW